MKLLYYLSGKASRRTGMCTARIRRLAPVVDAHFKVGLCNADGRVLSVQDRNGNTTSYSYDPRGLLLSVSVCRIR